MPISLARVADAIAMVALVFSQPTLSGCGRDEVKPGLDTAPTNNSGTPTTDGQRNQRERDNHERDNHERDSLERNGEPRFRLNGSERQTIVEGQRGDFHSAQGQSQVQDGRCGDHHLLQGGQ